LLKTIYCPVCSNRFERKDHVFLDKLNTITHQHCYSQETNYIVKDLGTYESIVEQYDFFQEDIETI